MTWLIVLIVVIVAAAIAILFLNRFYRKATREVALVRTGAGGKRVVLDGGCLALPFLHNVAEVNMKTMRLEVARHGDRSLITADRLRVDVAVEFSMHVSATADGVAVAAQTLGGKTFRAGELQEMVGGKLVDGLQATVAARSMDELHENRAEFVKALREHVREPLAMNGLELESASLVQLDQTPFDALSENNAFNAVGMRRLAEVISQNRKQRAAIEADAEVAVRESQLTATKRRLTLDQEEEQAQIGQQLEIEKMRADQAAEIAERQSDGRRRAESARIAQEREVRAAEIARDRQLRELQLESGLAVDIAEQDKAIALARKAVAQRAAEAEAERARAEAVTAAEHVQTEKERAAAERGRAVAVIRANEKAEVEDIQLRSATGTVREQAKAEADAMTARAGARKAELLAEAEGKAALVKAENGLSEPVIRMRTEMHKIDALPELVAQMVKPAEKIDSIRINHLSGFGQAGGGEPGNRSLVNQAVDSVMSMALQLPALQKLGREIGIDLEKGLAGIGEPPDDDEPRGEGGGRKAN